jgi:hypothetical protein
MTRPLRMLNGGILGALLGVAVGIGVGGVISLLCSLAEDPLDRWHVAGAVFVLSIASCTLLGLVAGLASRVSENGVPLLQSVIAVAITTIAATLFSVCLDEAMLLVGAVVGIVIGGVVVVLTGLGNRPRPTIANQNDEASISHV